MFINVRVLGNVPLFNYKPSGMFGDFSNLTGNLKRINLTSRVNNTNLNCIIQKLPSHTVVIVAMTSTKNTN